MQNSIKKYGPSLEHGLMEQLFEDLYLICMKSIHVDNVRVSNGLKTRRNLLVENKVQKL